jgi:8-oxo-dGTP diphosphatase
MSERITVVAAIVERDGLILICQRRQGDRFGLKWEFPGGKVQTGETPEQALARELREELGVSARVGKEVFRTRHRYAEVGGELELIFFLADLGPEPLENHAFEQVVWSERGRLTQFDFLPADRELITLLANESL